MNRIGFLLAAVICVCYSAMGATPPTGKYKTTVEKFTQVQAKYPGFSHLFTIGENDEGTELIAMRIGTTAGAVDPQKVGHLIVGTHHGNEGACPLFVAHLAEEILKRYTSDELFRGNLADTQWTLIPVLNVTGYNANSRNEYGKDPNRDYPGVCNSQPGGKLKSIRQFTSHLSTRVYSGSLTVHGYVGALTYPWGVDADNLHTLDHNQFDSITSKAAAINQYRYGTSTDVVYPADNTYEDFAYWKYGMWSLLLEMRDGSQSDIVSTAKAVQVYFDLLDSSPSIKNQFTGHCLRSKPDLHIE